MIPFKVTWFLQKMGAVWIVNKTNTMYYGLLVCGGDICNVLCTYVGHKPENKKQ